MKKIIRDEIKEKRNNLGSEEITSKSSLIIEKLASLPEIEKASTIMFYYPANNEVDLVPLMEGFLGKKILLLPRLIENDLEPFLLENFDKMIIGKFNIHEPASEKHEGEIDVVIVPGVAFSKNKHRLGMGLGYYDKFLEGKNVVKIGVCYDFQLVDNVWQEPHDIPVDILITEKEIMK